MGGGGVFLRTLRGRRRPARFRAGRSEDGIEMEGRGRGAGGQICSAERRHGDGFRKYKYNQIHRKSAMKLEETLKARREEILAIAEKYGVRNVRRLSAPSPAARPTREATSTFWWSRCRDSPSSKARP